MKLIFKTVQNKVLEFEINPKEKVKITQIDLLRAKAEEFDGLEPGMEIILLHFGKILFDNTKIDEYKINENDVIVIYKRKKKESPFKIVDEKKD